MKAYLPGILQDLQPLWDSNVHVNKAMNLLQDTTSQLTPLHVVVFL